MAITRRRFLTWLGAAGTGIAVAKNTHAASNKQFTGHPQSKGVLHDITRCVGCRSCEKACKKVNKLPAPEKEFADLTVLNEKRRTSSSVYTVVNKYKKPGNKKTVFRKNQCNHCLEPACASACFVRAFKKTEKGPVVYDHSVCVGCRYCMIACPFEIPAYEYDNPLNPKVTKCTMCAPRLEKGLIPGCVDVCPNEALTFGKREELIQIARERIQKFPGRYKNHIYGEYEMGGTSWIYISGMKFSQVDMREDLGIMPAPSLTSGALSAVPIVVGLWPVFLAGMYGMTLRRNKITDEEKERAIAIAMEEVNDLAEEKLASVLEKAESDKLKALETAELEKEKAVKEALESMDRDIKTGEEE